MNATDRTNSTMDENLQKKYKSVDEFIRHASLVRLIDFLKACQRINMSENLINEVATALVVRGSQPEQSEQVTRAIESSPHLRAFVKIVGQMGKYFGDWKMPLDFSSNNGIDIHRQQQQPSIDKNKDSK